MREGKSEGKWHAGATARAAERVCGYIPICRGTLQPGIGIWTRDKRLGKAAEELGLAAGLLH